MSVLVANCPSCGAPVEFKSGQSIVVICEYCHSAVARTDRELKDLGKVAELVETGSPLDIGLRGQWEEGPIEITWPAQLRAEIGATPARTASERPAMAHASDGRGNRTRHRTRREGRDPLPAHSR